MRIITIIIVITLTLIQFLLTCTYDSQVFKIILYFSFFLAFSIIQYCYNFMSIFDKLNNRLNCKLGKTLGTMMLECVYFQRQIYILSWVTIKVLIASLICQDLCWTIQQMDFLILFQERNRYEDSQCGYYNLVIKHLGNQFY